MPDYIDKYKRKVEDIERYLESVLDLPKQPGEGPYTPMDRMTLHICELRLRIAQQIFEAEKTKAERDAREPDQ